MVSLYLKISTKRSLLPFPSGLELRCSEAVRRCGARQQCNAFMWTTLPLSARTGPLLNEHKRVVFKVGGQESEKAHAEVNVLGVEVDLASRRCRTTRTMLPRDDKGSARRLAVRVSGGSLCSTQFVSFVSQCHDHECESWDDCASEV